MPAPSYDPSTLYSIADWIQCAKSAVVLTGAGISTESGIPDFRSPGGIWSRHRIVYFDEFLASTDARHDYWRQKCELHPHFRDACPNAGHRMLAHWEQQRQIRGVITQNIDGLHQLSGSRRVLELHGTARQAMCLDCRVRVDIEPLVQQFLAEERVPACTTCGGRLKHATISFGQILPTEVLDEAICWAQETDLMLVAGSSLVVTPAAVLPSIAKQNGAKLVIVNREPTPLDDLADVVVRNSIGEALRSIDAAMSTT